MLIDARGLECPKPVTAAEEALAKMGEGVVEVLVDNEGSAGNLAKFASTSGYHSEAVQDGNLFRVKIMKGHSREAPAESEKAREQERDILLVIGSDILGKEDTLGKILMKGYFDTMKIYRQLPHTMFFLNAGVKLTTIDEEIVPILKEFEAMGVEIYSCGTCLKHYKLENMIKVGHWGTMNNLVEGMQDFNRTVWIG